MGLENWKSIKEDMHIIDLLRPMKDKKWTLNGKPK